MSCILVRQQQPWMSRACRPTLLQFLFQLVRSISRQGTLQYQLRASSLARSSTHHLAHASSVEAFDIVVTEVEEKVCMSNHATNYVYFMFHETWKIVQCTLTMSNAHIMLNDNSAKSINLTYWMFSLPSSTRSGNIKFWSRKHDANCETRRWHTTMTSKPLKKHHILVNYTKGRNKEFSCCWKNRSRWKNNTKVFSRVLLPFLLVSSKLSRRSK